MSDWRQNDYDWRRVEEILVQLGTGDRLFLKDFLLLHVRMVEGAERLLNEMQERVDSVRGRQKPGPKRYGENENKHLRAKEEWILGRMKEWRSWKKAYSSYSAIARQLNQYGNRTRRGKMWAAQSVKNVLAQWGVA